MFRLITVIISLWKVLSVTGQDCTNGVVVGGICHTLVKENRTFALAEEYCRLRGAYLAAVVSPDYQRPLADYARDQGLKQLWIGGKEISTLWRWKIDERILSPQGCYKDDLTTPDLQVVMDMPRLIPSDCVGNCSKLGYVYSGLQAGTRCWCGNSYGRYGKAEGCTVKCPGASQEKVEWCGGYGKTSVYLNTGEYGDWSYNQPNNWEGHQLCGIVDGSTEYKFQDEECYRQLQHICDIPMNLCFGVNFISYRDSCYYRSTSALSWFQAESDCKARGGSLLTIRSPDEHEKLRRAMFRFNSKEKYWIGLYSGTWKWSNGATIQWTNWQQGEPQATAQQCILMSTVSPYRWRTAACSTLNGFFCQGGFPADLTTQVVTTTEAATTAEETTISETTLAQPTGAPPTEPGSGASTAGNSLDTLTIVLIVLGIILLIAVIALIVFCIVMKKKNPDKVEDYEKVYDARPDAPIPEHRRLSTVSGGLYDGSGYTGYNDNRVYSTMKDSNSMYYR